jgi:hypothetical protein
MATSWAEELTLLTEDVTPPPPPHPAKIINRRDTSKSESSPLLFNMLFSSSANSAKILIVISGGSANIESSDSLVPLLCVPGFPRVCSEQRKNYKHKIQKDYKDRVKTFFNAEAMIRIIRKKVCDMDYNFFSVFAVIFADIS